MCELRRLGSYLLNILIIIDIVLSTAAQLNNVTNNNNNFTVLQTTDNNHHNATIQEEGVLMPETTARIASGTTTTTNQTRQAPPRVRLNKCCQLNEYLDDTQACMTSGSSEEPWVPLIFLILQRRYYQPRGLSPKFITFTPNVRPITKPTPQAVIINNATTTTNETIAAAAAKTTETEATETTCHSASELTYFSSTSVSNSKFVIFSNGSLYLQERGMLIEPRNYCVDREAALVCLPKQVQAQLQLKKCCGKYGSYDAVNKKCTFDTGGGGGLAHESSGKLKLSPLNESVYQTLYGLPECPEAIGSSYAIAGDWQEAHLNVHNGYLTLPHKNLSSIDYCLEHLHTKVDGGDVKIIACSHHFALNMSADNYESEQLAATNQRVRDVILHTCIVISVVFLAATLVAGYMLPSVHHALHWRCQIYYVFSLFVGEFLYAYSLLSNSLEPSSWLCAVIASGTQFFFLAAFFWLNTMCFNIWWTFRDFRPSSLERNQETLRLRLYSAYAWGIPLLISAIAACVDLLPETQLLHPGFGQNGCWFANQRLSIFAYFFGPIGLLLCVNIILFISTTHQLTCGLWKRDDVKSTTEKTALGKVCLKLVVVMGVTWIADVISWLIDSKHSIWFVTDLLNALQGVFIFIVVGCQPQVWAACKRIWSTRGRHDITNTTNGVQHSSSSQGLPSVGGGGGGIGAGAGGLHHGAGINGGSNYTEFTQNTSMTMSSSATYNGNEMSSCSEGGGGGNGHDSAGGTGNIFVCSTTGANAQLNNSTTTNNHQHSKIPMETVC